MEKLQNCRESYHLGVFEVLKISNSALDQTEHIHLCVCVTSQQLEGYHLDGNHLQELRIDLLDL